MTTKQSLNILALVNGLILGLSDYFLLHQNVIILSYSGTSREDVTSETLFLVFALTESIGEAAEDSSGYRSKCITFLVFVGI